MKKIQLLVVDDHEIVRLGLRTLLESEPDLSVIAEASTADEALAQIKNFRPDVVILDIQLPKRSGLDICREIVRTFPETRIVMLTSSTNKSYVLDAMRAGASGYVLKQVGNNELVRAVRAAHRGEIALDAKISAQLIAHMKNLEKASKGNAFQDISQRKLEVLSLVARGLGNKEIGIQLNLSEVTVRNYITAMMQRLNLHNRVELALYAVQNHIEEYMNMNTHK